jgi:hypothetical protein
LGKSSAAHAPWARRKRRYGRIAHRRIDLFMTVQCMFLRRKSQGKEKGVS